MRGTEEHSGSMKALSVPCVGLGGNVAGEGTVVVGGTVVAGGTVEVDDKICSLRPRDGFTGWDDPISAWIDEGRRVRNRSIF